MSDRAKIERMKPLRAVLAAAALAGLLSGCTLIGHLGAPTDVGSDAPVGEDETTQTEAAEDPSGHTPNPTEGGDPTETIVVPDGPDGAPERINVEIELNVPHEIVGKSGDVVGSLTVTNVQDDTTCPSAHADESKNGKFVIVSFEVTADESLREQDDPWYGRNFDLSTVDIIDPYTGVSIRGGLDYDCLDAKDRLGTVQPGQTAKGSLAFDVNKELFAVGWFYGHQYFYVPPSFWGGI